MEGCIRRATFKIFCRSITGNPIVSSSSSTSSSQSIAQVTSQTPTQLSYSNYTRSHSVNSILTAYRSDYQ
eukprot:c17597_g1_i1 orf=117-326(-)